MYSSSLAHIFFKNDLQIKYFFLDFTSEENYSFGNSYAWLTGITCRAFTGYKVGETFSDGSLESKLIGSFCTGVALSGGFAKFLNKEICVLATANIFLSGFTAAALAYIWHEDSDQMSGIPEDISL